MKFLIDVIKVIIGVMIAQYLTFLLPYILIKFMGC